MPRLSAPGSPDDAFGYVMQELYLDDNQLNGTLPTWSNLDSVKVYVQPGNDGLCGVVSCSSASQCICACGVHGAWCMGVHVEEQVCELGQLC